MSIEVSPDIATDAKTSTEEALRIFSLINEKNILIKIPATKEGLEIIPVLIAKGININVTLMFSLNHYIDVANAYIKGLKTAYANGYNLSSINSVASIFISRVDTMVDKTINDLISGEAASNTAKKRETCRFNRKSRSCKFQNNF